MLMIMSTNGMLVIIVWLPAPDAALPEPIYNGTIDAGTSNEF